MSTLSQQDLKQLVDDAHTYVVATTAKPVTPRWQHLKKFALNAGTLALTAFLIPVVFKAVEDPLASLVNGYVNNRDNLVLDSKLYSAPVASSYRQDTDHPTIHRPLNLLDDDPKTDWEECRGGTPVYPGTTRSLGDSCKTEPQGQEGAGEWVEIPLTFPVEIRAIRIRNGYQGSPALFMRNPRAGQVDIEALGNSGELLMTKRVTLADETGYQNVALKDDGGSVRATKIRITIITSRPGETFLGDPPYSDAGFSDIQLIPAKVAPPRRG